MWSVHVHNKCMITREEGFRRKVETEIRSIPAEVVLGANLNGHVATDNDG